MSSLSLNWKKLSSKLSKKEKTKNALSQKLSITTNSSKPSKVIKPKITTKSTEKVPISKAKSTKKPLKSSTVPKEEAKPTPKILEPVQQPVSPLEYALWTHENEISPSDIPKGPTPLSTGDNNGRKKAPGKYIAMDCEFVGVGPEGSESALARVSLVNYYGHVVFDSFVKPQEKVTDWRTWVSGVSAKHMESAITFEEAQAVVAKLLDKKVLVGHAVHHDLESLFLSHPRLQLRDTSTYKPFRELSMGKTPALKKLALHFLEVEIQKAEHSSVEDARATMLLFRTHRKQFERVFNAYTRK